MNTRRFLITESDHVSKTSLILAFGPVLLIAAGSIAAWTTSKQMLGEVAQLTILWAASILLFLGGVQRGLSFRTAVGESTVQIAFAILLFVLGEIALLVMIFGHLVAAASIIAFGYFLTLIGDPIAAARVRAPLFFERLRPPQMAVAIFGLALLLWRLLSAQ